MSLPSPAVYVGAVAHRRLAPKPHAFRYPAYQVLVDLDGLDDLARTVGIFGHNRPGLTGLYDRDYMTAEERPVKEKLREWLAARSVTMGDARVFLLTNLRVLGYVFNPVSFYYGFSPDGTWRFSIAEINNTFGERYAYLLPDDGARFPKVFHVSPFIGMSAAYEFTLTRPGETVSVHVDEFEEDAKFFDASFTGTRRPLTTGALARVLFLYPHQTARTIAWIHWEALRLWLKGLRVFTKPEPPGSGLLARRDS